MEYETLDSESICFGLTHSMYFLSASNNNEMFGESDYKSFPQTPSL